MSDADVSTGALWPVPLPDFDRPPLIETVMAVHFSPVPALDSVAVLDFWRTHLLDAYPSAEERERHVPTIESFDRPAPRVPRLEFRRGPHSPLYWLHGSTGEVLLQVQNDWLAFNWRKPGKDADYRHYEYGEERFRRAYEQLSTHVNSISGEALDPAQIEISYINEIRAADGGWSTHDELHRVFVRAGEAADGHLPRAEAQAMMLQFIAQDDDGKPFGRLHVAAEAGFAHDTGEPLFALTLTFKAKPLGTDLPGVLRALDYGHDWIVGGFAELTTPAMHEIWGMKERTS